MSGEVRHAPESVHVECGCLAQSINILVATLSGRDTQNFEPRVGFAVRLLFIFDDFLHPPFGRLVHIIAHGEEPDKRVSEAETPELLGQEDEAVWDVFDVEALGDQGLQILGHAVTAAVGVCAEELLLYASVRFQDTIKVCLSEAIRRLPKGRHDRYSYPCLYPRENTGTSRELLVKLLGMCINPSLVNDSGSSIRVELQQANYDITVRKFLGKLIGLGGFVGQAYPTRLFLLNTKPVTVASSYAACHARARCSGSPDSQKSS